MEFISPVLGGSSRNRNINEMENECFRKLRNFVNNTYEDSPISLETLISDQNVLLELKSLIYEAIKSLDKITSSKFKALDISLRFLCSELVKFYTTNDTQDDLASECSRLRYQVAELSSTIEKLEKRLMEPETDVNSKLINLQRERDNLSNKYNEILKSRDQLRYELEIKVSNLEEEISIKDHRYSLLESSDKALQEQLTTYEDEILALKLKLNKMSDKLSTKREKINELTVENHNLQSCLENMELKNNQLSFEYSTLKLQKEGTSNKGEVERLKNENDELIKTVEKLNDTLEGYIDRFSKSEIDEENIDENLDSFKKINDIKVENQRLSTENANLHKKLEQYKDSNKSLNSQLSTVMDLNTNQKMIINKILEYLGKDPDSDPIEAVKELSSKSLDYNGISRESRILAGFQSLSCFLLKLCNNEIKFEPFIKGDGYINDDTVKNQIINIINELRDVVTGDFGKDVIRDIGFFDIYFGSDEKTASLLDRLTSEGFPDLYASIAGLAAVNCLQYKILNQIINDLSYLRKYIPPRTIDRNIGGEIHKFVQPIIQSLSHSSNLIRGIKNYCPRGKSDIQVVTEFIECSIALLDEFRAYSKYVNAGNDIDNIYDIPRIALQELTKIKRDNVISSLSEDINNLRDKHKKEIIEMYDDNSRKESEIIELRNEVNSLSEKVRRKDDHISELKEKLKSIKGECKTVSVKFNEFECKYEYLERENTELKEDIETLKKMLRERADMYKSQLKSDAESMQNHYESKISKIEDRYKEKLNELSYTTSVKIGKLEEDNKRLRELATGNDEIMKKQRSSIRDLMDNIRVLEKKIDETPSCHAFEKRIEELTQQLQNSMIIRSKQNVDRCSPVKLDNVLSPIGQALEDLGVSRLVWTQTAVISAIRELSLRNTSTQDLSRPSGDLHASHIKDSDASVWDRWAKRALLPIANKTGNLSSEEMRNTIDDLLQVSSTKFKLLSSLQSLRVQKKLLKQHSVVEAMKSKPGEITSVLPILFCILFVKVTSYKVNRKNRRIQNLQSE